MSSRSPANESWPPAAIALLLQLRPHHQYTFIAIQLGKSPGAVKAKCRQLGINHRRCATCQRILRGRQTLCNRCAHKCPVCDEHVPGLRREQWCNSCKEQAGSATAIHDVLYRDELRPTDLTERLTRYSCRAQQQLPLFGD